MILEPSEQGVWKEELVTRIRRIVYDFETQVADFYLPAFCVTDGRGAVALAQKIDPDVRRINVFCDFRLDCVYAKHPNGNWRLTDCRVLKFNDEGGYRGEQQSEKR